MTETKKLGLVDLVAISCGQVIGAGVVTLIGTAIVATGTSAWLAYGAAVVVGFISIIPFIFISSTTMLQGGEYSIVADMLNEKMAGFYAIHITMPEPVFAGDIAGELCQFHIS